MDGQLVHNLVVTVSVFKFKITDDESVIMPLITDHFFAACLGFLSRLLQQFPDIGSPSKELHGIFPHL